MHSLKASFCLSYRPASEEAGGGQEAGRERSQDSRPQLSRGISHIMGYGDLPSSKSWGKDGWEMFRVPALLEALLSWRWLHICLPMRSSKFMPLCALLSWGTFPLLSKLSLSQPMHFLPLPFQFQLGVSEGAAVWCLGAYRLTYSTRRSFVLIAWSLVTWH